MAIWIVSILLILSIACNVGLTLGLGLIATKIKDYNEFLERHNIFDDYPMRYSIGRWDEIIRLCSPEYRKMMNDKEQ